MRAFLYLRRPVCRECTIKLYPFVTRSFSLTATHWAGETSRRLPNGPCRTRFAPSPTGYLHLGSLRTALFNYLLARATKGQFLLRLEDTDQRRLVEDAETRLYNDLRWAGLSWDEGPDVGGPFGPYRQSERLKLYDEHADKLIEEGKAYRCFCSPEVLETHKRHAHEHGLSTDYPGTCMALSEAESDERARAGQPYAVRFKSSKEPVAVHDLVYRRFKKAEPEEDFIIRKRDGFPTYHFANVVDDHAMEVTHVVRGAEWLISTPKHVELYNAFGWQPPQFVHVGLLVNSERQKLSKRHPGVDLSWYKNEGILPPALLNFAVLLGWHQGHAKDIMTLPEMIDNFSLKFTRGDIIVNMGKLPYFQKQHTKRLLAEEPPNMDLLTAHFIRPIEGIIKSMEEARLAKRSYSGFDVSLLGDMVAQLESEPAGPQHRVLKALKANKPSISTLEDFVKDNKYLFWAVPQQVLKARLEGLHLRDSSLEEGSGKREATLEEVMAFFKRKFERFAGIWASQDLTPAIKQAAASVTFVDTETGRKMESGGYKLLRWSLLGGDSGPGLGDVMEILGRDETLRRVEYSRKTADTWAERAS